MPALPVIAVTSGEPAGIGPELCLRLAGRRFDARLVVLGDRELLAARAAALGLNVRLRDWVPEADAPAPDVLDVLHLPLAQPAQAGRLDPANAPYVLGLLDRALAGCRAGADGARTEAPEFAAMVTAPVHKGVINAAGVPFTGHTEYLACRSRTCRPQSRRRPSSRRCVSCTPRCGASTASMRRASSSPDSTRMPAKTAISAARRSK